MWIGLAFAVILVAIRTHVQYKSSQRLFVNDYWIFFALLCHFATAIVYQIAISPMYELAYVGAGLQLPRAGFMDRASLFLKLQYAADLLLWTTLWSVKFSLLFFFWRLFDSVNSSMRLFWWIMCGVTASTWITSVVLQEFACDPIRDFFTLGKKTRIPFFRFPHTDSWQENAHRRKISSFPISFFTFQSGPTLRETFAVGSLIYT